MLTAMADAHDGIVRYRMMAAVAVKLAMVLATSPYGDEKAREREVRDATMVAGHGRSWSLVVFYGHGGDGDMKCGFTLAQMVALVGRGGR